MDTTGLTLYSLEAEEKTFLAAFRMPEVCCFLLLLLHTNTNKSSFSAEQWVFLHSHMQIPCISSPLNSLMQVSIGKRKKYGCHMQISAKASYTSTWKFWLRKLEGCVPVSGISEHPVFLCSLYSSVLQGVCSEPNSPRRPNAHTLHQTPAHKQ